MIVKRTREEITQNLTNLYNRTIELIASENLTHEEACNRVGWHASQYYKYKRGLKPMTISDSPKAKPVVSQLRVTDLPVVNSDNGRAFIVYGSPKALAEFVRAYE